MLSLLLYSDSEWTYTSGEHWWGGWVGFLLLLIPTFFANVVTLILVTYSPRLNRSSSSLMVRYLSIEDGLFSLFCLVQCALNLSRRQIVGDFVGCEIQAIYALFFMLASGYTLCCIAYNSEQKISFKPGLTPRAVFWLHVLIWCFSLLIAFLSSLIIADARIMPSSTYCLVSLVSLQAGLVFYIPGVFVIGAFLSHRYFLIYLHVTRETGELVSAYAQQKHLAQRRQITVAKRMFVIVCAYFVCALPVVVISIYESIVGYDAPAAAHLWAGHMVHVNSLLNPILYVWMNSATRAALWELFGYGPTRMMTTNKHPAEEGGADGQCPDGHLEEFNGNKADDDVNDAVGDSPNSPNTFVTEKSSTAAAKSTKDSATSKTSAEHVPMTTKFLNFSSKHFHLSRISQSSVESATIAAAHRSSLMIFDSPMRASRVAPLTDPPAVLLSNSPDGFSALPVNDAPLHVLNPQASASGVPRSTSLSVITPRSPQLLDSPDRLVGNSFVRGSSGLSSSQDVTSSHALPGSTLGGDARASWSVMDVSRQPVEEEGSMENSAGPRSDRPEGSMHYTPNDSPRVTLDERGGTLGVEVAHEAPVERRRGEERQGAGGDVLAPPHERDREVV